MTENDRKRILKVFDSACKELSDMFPNSDVTTEAKVDGVTVHQYEMKRFGKRNSSYAHYVANDMRYGIAPLVDMGWVKDQILREGSK